MHDSKNVYDAETAIDSMTSMLMECFHYFPERVYMATDNNK